MPEEVFHITIVDNLDEFSGRAGKSTKTLAELRKELNESKNKFDGSAKAVSELSAVHGQYSERLDQVRQATGQTQSFTEKLSSTIQRQVVQVGGLITAWMSVRVIREEIAKTITAMEESSQAVARFAAITDQSLGEATQQYRALREAAG